MPAKRRWVAEFKFANWFQACNVARHILHCHGLITDDEHDRIVVETKAKFPEHPSLQMSGPTALANPNHPDYPRF
jgi:hypothetical protein